MSKAKNIAIIIGCCLLILVSINILTQEPVSDKNSKTIQGHFQSITEADTRGDTSYQLHIQEDNNSYTISADNSQCFQYNLFKSEVKEGQLIKISTCQNDFLTNASVVSLVVDSTDYISKYCINEHIEGERFTLPLFCGGFTIIMVIYLVYQNKKGRKINSKY